MKVLKANLRKNIETGILIGLICAVLMSFSHFDAQCDDLRSNVLRLHIIANSDSAEDQALKLQVRDAILKESGLIFDNCVNLDDAIAAAKLKIPEISEIANRVIKEKGFKYSSKTEVGNSYFETREYDDFTLPAGTYKSLILKLGKAEGHNWWCVIFPSVCLPAATDASLSDTASKSSAYVAEHPKKYVIKFKTVEWYQDLVKKITGK